MCIKKTDVYQGAPGVMVVDAGLGKQRSERLSDPRRRRSRRSEMVVGAVLDVDMEFMDLGRLMRSRVSGSDVSPH